MRETRSVGRDETINFLDLDDGVEEEDSVEYSVKMVNVKREADLMPIGTLT